MTKQNFKSIEFKTAKIPQPVESWVKDVNSIVYYGTSYNSYPMYLLDLYNSCGTHQAIVNGKADFIVGTGLQYQDGSMLNFMANAQDSVQELIEKCVKDYLIFGYYALTVHYDITGKPYEFFHVPAQLVLTNKLKTKFWYNEDWQRNGRRNTVEFERWSKNYGGVTSTMFFFDGYTPTSNKVYTAPDYNAAIRSIRIDSDIERFISNNINNHFSPSTIIDFFTGTNVSDEAKDAMMDELENGYTGVDGQKIIASWNDPNSKKTEVTNISPTDWTDAFNAAAKNAQDRIFIGHGVVSPMLFGVKTEGQLGGATELETAYEIFKNGYINRKRKQLLNSFTLLFSNYEGVAGKPLIFGDRPLFTPKIDPALKEKIMTINEIRKEAGLPAIENGDRFIDQPQTMMLQPVKPTPTQQMESDKKKDESDVLNQFNNMADTFGYSFEDFELVEDNQDNFSVVQRLKFSVDTDISDYVINNDIRDLTLAQLKDLILKDVKVKISIKDLRDVLNRLSKSGIIEVDYADGKVKVTPSNLTPVPDSDKIQVMYQYVKRKEIDGPVLLQTSRPFCVKLINNNRLYTRAEVQQMSALFGYSVFDYTGGWYYNPETDETTPYCRHEWKTVRAKKKG